MRKYKQLKKTAKNVKTAFKKKLRGQWMCRMLAATQLKQLYHLAVNCIRA
jgi:hypothetical protein